MDDPLVQAVAATAARDALWRNPPALADGCEHDLELLPVIEARFTVVCRKCGGLDLAASRAIGSSDPDAPEYVILGDSSVRPLSAPVRVSVSKTALSALIRYADAKRDQSDSQFLAGAAEYKRSQQEFDGLVAALDGP